jgi:hypothetical protein
VAVASQAEEPPVSTSSPDWPITNTEHGMLVAFGLRTQVVEQSDTVAEEDRHEVKSYFVQH